MVIAMLKCHIFIETELVNSCKWTQSPAHVIKAIDYDSLAADLEMFVALLNESNGGCEFSYSVILTVMYLRTRRAQALCSAICPRGHDP